MACFLSESERERLLNDLRFHQCRADSIDVHPTFSMEGKLISMVEKAEIKECWLYHLDGKRIEKYRLRV